jgi:hypothetical protein
MLLLPQPAQQQLLLLLRQCRQVCPVPADWCCHCQDTQLADMLYPGMPHLA